MYEMKVVNIRLVEDRSLYSPDPIHNADDAVKIMQKELSQYDREVMCVLNLDTKNRVININFASMGTINASLVAPREIFKTSILSNAASIMLMHNHPSGEITPSKEDIKVTNTLVKCGVLMDIQVLDHIIIGGDKFYSFLYHGLIPKSNDNKLVFEHTNKSQQTTRISRKLKL